MERRTHSLMSRRRSASVTPGLSYVTLVLPHPRSSNGTTDNAMKRERHTLEVSRLRVSRASSMLDQLDVLQRQATHGLAGCGKDRVEHRRRDHADRRLAHSAPEVQRGHDHRLDLDRKGVV